MKKLVVDIKLKRPACVLLQAALGGDVELARKLPSESWLTYPTADMQMVQTTDEEIEMFRKMLVQKFSQRRGP